MQYLYVKCKCNHFLKVCSVGRERERGNCNCLLRLSDSPTKCSRQSGFERREKVLQPVYNSFMKKNPVHNSTYEGKGKMSLNCRICFLQKDSEQKSLTKYKSSKIDFQDKVLRAWRIDSSQPSKMGNSIRDFKTLLQRHLVEKKYWVWLRKKTIFKLKNSRIDDSNAPLFSTVIN